MLRLMDINKREAARRERQRRATERALKRRGILKRAIGGTVDSMQVAVVASPLLPISFGALLLVTYEGRQP